MLGTFPLVLGPLVRTVALGSRLPPGAGVWADTVLSSHRGDSRHLHGQALALLCRVAFLPLFLRDEHSMCTAHRAKLSVVIRWVNFLLSRGGNDGSGKGRGLPRTPQLAGGKAQSLASVPPGASWPEAELPRQARISSGSWCRRSSGQGGTRGQSGGGCLEEEGWSRPGDREGVMLSRGLGSRKGWEGGRAPALGGAVKACETAQRHQLGEGQGRYEQSLGRKMCARWPPCCWKPWGSASSK